MIPFDKLARSDAHFDKLARAAFRKAAVKESPVERAAALHEQRKHLLDDLERTRKALKQVEYELADAEQAIAADPDNDGPVKMMKLALADPRVWPR